VAKEEKELGCILVDIGAQTINIAVFVESILCHIGQIDIGSDFITYDIAHGLRTSFKEAKRIKETYGHAVSNETLDTKIEYVGVDGQSKNTISMDTLNKIIEPRVDDMLDLIWEEITKSRQQQMVPGGIILSGGGSELKGMDYAIRNRFENFQVRLGRPRNLGGKVEKVNAPKYATAVGLMAYALETEASLGIHDMSPRKGGFFEKIKIWFEEMF
jgi:cell division protein FtsA